MEGGDNISSEQYETFGLPKTYGSRPICVSGLFLSVQSPISMLIPGTPRSDAIVAGQATEEISESSVPAASIARSCLELCGRVEFFCRSVSS